MEISSLQKKVTFTYRKHIIEMCKIKYFICDPVPVTKNCDLFKQN